MTWQPRTHADQAQAMMRDVADALGSRRRHGDRQHHDRDPGDRLSGCDDRDASRSSSPPGCSSAASSRSSRRSPAKATPACRCSPRSSACCRSSSGFALLRTPFQSVEVVIFVLGIFWVAQGIVRFVDGVRGASRAGTGRSSRAILGVVAGIVVLSTRSMSAVTLALFGGIWLIIFGGHPVLRRLPAAERRQGHWPRACAAVGGLGGRSARAPGAGIALVLSCRAAPNRRPSRERSRPSARGPASFAPA